MEFAHEQGTPIGVQLAHAGRKDASYAPWLGQGSVPEIDGGWPTAGPSPVAFDGYATPAELTSRQIADLIAAFAEAARRADDAGFDVVEVHAAHGYLLHQFLSPLANHRTDAYGGSFENRTRLVLKVVDAVRAAWPAGKPVLVRISATDCVDGGWTVAEAADLGGLLREQASIWSTRRRAAWIRPSRSPSAPATRCRSPGTSGPRAASRPAPSG